MAINIVSSDVKTVAGKTKGTRDQYLAVAMDLELRALRYYELPTNSPAHPSTLVRYLVSQLPQIRPATVRLYKASLRCFFEKILSEGDEEGIYAEALIKLEDVHPIARRKDLPARTSAKKKKSVSEDDLIRLSERMVSSGAFWPPRALRFLQASIVTGLRPIEWEHAEWLSETSIIVRNAKHTNGRAHGVTRIVEVPAGDWLAPTVKLHMDLLREWLTKDGNTFDKYYQNCRKALQRSHMQLWPKREGRVTLYSGRHQFCANLKSKSATPEELAYSMGHAVTETAQSHYGKRRSGWGRKPNQKSELASAPKVPGVVLPNEGMNNH